MSRRRDIPKRPVEPDAKFQDKAVTLFINAVMTRGKKSTAEGIVYGAFDIVKSRGVEDPIDLFRKAVENVGPVVETKSRRVGGATYQVPVEVEQGRRIALALRWIRDVARDRPGRSMEERLAAELMEAAGNRGGAVKKREEVHRMAEANRAFSHYRW